MFDVSTIPVGLYIHTPWCVRKCPYCDFNSHAVRGAIPEKQYVEALLEDFRGQAALLNGRTIDTIFIGGGTPSLFAASAIGRLLEGIGENATLSPGLEVTMEANPGAVECGVLEQYREIGVTRISLGVQSFNEQHLVVLGRVHDSAEAITAARRALEAGFSELNLDLMFGLPGQLVEESLRDLSQAIELGPSHISFYQLTLEPNTQFYRQPPILPEEDDLFEMQEMGIQQLQQAGYGRYEISAYSKPGHRCEHNVNYWSFGDYLGIGAGAHGKLSSAEDGVINRYWNVKGPEAYMQGAMAGNAQSGSRSLADDDRVLEFMMNGLRLVEGVPERLFEQRTGLSRDVIEQNLVAMEGRGMIRRKGGVISATELGIRFLDDLLLEFQ